MKRIILSALVGVLFGLPGYAKAEPSDPMACLKTKPTTALVTYPGRNKPVKVKIEKILPTCIRFNYSGGAMWTKASAAGGISCVGEAVQIDAYKASSAFTGIEIRKFTPARLCPAEGTT